VAASPDGKVPLEYSTLDINTGVRGFISRSGREVHTTETSR